MKAVRRLAGKKAATDDEEEDLVEALQLAALEASAVADAATLSSGSSSPRRQQWLADQKDYSIRMNCVISPFMAQIATEHEEDLEGVQAFTASAPQREATKKPRPKSLDPKEQQRLHKEFAKEEKERQRLSKKMKRESAFVYLPSLQAGRTMRKNEPAPTTAVPLQPLSTMRPRSMCLRELALASPSPSSEPTTGDTSPTPPPAIDEGTSPAPVIGGDDDIIPPPLPPRE